MAVSEVTICNLALSWLAGNLIISIDDDINEARLCKANYELSRDAVLETIAWTFATKRYALTPEVAAPAWGYNYQFTIPADIITLLDVTANSDTPNGANDLDWRREGNLILCDASKVYVKATFKQIDPARYPPNFVQAVAARLATEIAIPLTESSELMRLMEGKYKDRLLIAAGTDGTQGKVDVIDSRHLTGVRL
jgi:hypothetical protein